MCRTSFKAGAVQMKCFISILCRGPTSTARECPMLRERTYTCEFHGFMAAGQLGFKLVANGKSVWTN